LCDHLIKKGVIAVDSFIFDAVRVPTGKYGGALAQARPDDMAATVIGALVNRQPGVDPAGIDDVFFGNANGAGEENRNVARMASILAGLPTSVPGTTVNRLCGSGLEAVVQASRAIETGDSNLLIAGGVESMTRAPWVVAKPTAAFPRGEETMHSTTLGWRFVNPRMPEQWRISLGGSAEILAERYKIRRESQDQFAYESHQKAARAWSEGSFSNEIVQVDDAPMDRDESIRDDTSLEKLGTLKPAFLQGGTVTGGNSSPLSDGASALMLGSKDAGEQFGMSALARIAGRGVSGVDPDVFGIGPVQAANEALRKAGIGWGDLQAVELNEAFAAQSLACLALWPELDSSIVNRWGGAIALGHALGSSGSRILTTLVHGLHSRGGGWGLAALCVGVGQGIAVVVEVESQ
jgi:acetyl-CoA acetyltransferase family protein